MQDVVVEKPKKTKKHHHEHFYKYLTLEGFHDLLLGGHFRYSSTKIFNDPFDMQFELLRPYDAQGEIGEIYKLAYEDAKNGVISEKHKSNPMYKGVYDTLISQRERLTLPEIEEKVHKLINEGDHSQLFEALKPINKNLASAMDAMFIFCVTKNGNDPLMWSHYTQGHTGVVIKISCIQNEADLSSLCEAAEVSYNHEIPSLKISDLFGDQKDIGKRIGQSFLTKGQCWSYENEWRHIVKKDDFKGANYIYEKYKPEEIAAIYFGCRMPEDKRTALSEIIKKLLPKTEVFQAVKNQDMFSLKLKRLF
ncbi:DUF2971 domain-containing protein [Pseudobdellovibrio exovorus]|uniref:DUF2971 domain-containing protein n=1 Tax=Pseudobdellovibrio exovorus JSS TaxID=1184267 RepID=M4V559_9BACT|nr:DUF2971 domain-containing protein [Pseudobdellovibrio exovorus]AGH94323.1 hypothetical protein A11Q_103 [Pseudobdellovibrio exovorus JSS]